MRCSGSRRSVLVLLVFALATSALSGCLAQQDGEKDPPDATDDGPGASRDSAQAAFGIDYTPNENGTHWARPDQVSWEIVFTSNRFCDWRAIEGETRVRNIADGPLPFHIYMRANHDWMVANETGNIVRMVSTMVADPIHYALHEAPKVAPGDALRETKLGDLHVPYSMDGQRQVVDADAFFIAGAYTAWPMFLLEDVIGEPARFMIDCP